MNNSRDENCSAIQPFSAVLLKDGRKGAVIDVYTEPEPGCEIDFTSPDSEQIDTEVVAPSQIASVLESDRK